MRGHDLTLDKTYEVHLGAPLPLLAGYPLKCCSYHLLLETGLPVLCYGSSNLLVFFFFLKVSSTPDRGPELRTPRSGVSCSHRRPHQPISAANSNFQVEANVLLLPVNFDISYDAVQEGCWTWKRVQKTVVAALGFSLRWKSLRWFFPPVTPPWPLTFLPQYCDTMVVTKISS